MMVSTFVLTFFACHEAIVEPTDAPKEALKVALDALCNDDIDGYLAYVDFGAEMDSAQEKSLRSVIRLHKQWQQAEHSSVASIDIVDAVMKGDTVCTVFYQYLYADSVKEIASQKMVRKDGVWKLRLRN